PIHQLDVKNPFLNGHLSETMYMYQPPGISVTRDSTGMFMYQKKYALKLLDMAHMANCNPTWTLVNTKPKLGSDGDPISDPTLYCSLAGGL
nr:ribonuclease H-like domain-containing protein [Tanacetum cinerariifolium]